MKLWAQVTLLAEGAMPSYGNDSNSSLCNSVQHSGCERATAQFTPHHRTHANGCRPPHGTHLSSHRATKSAGHELELDVREGYRRG